MFIKSCCPWQSAHHQLPASSCKVASCCPCGDDIILSKVVMHCAVCGESVKVPSLFLHVSCSESEGSEGSELKFGNFWLVSVSRRITLFFSSLPSLLSVVGGGVGSSINPIP